MIFVRRLALLASLAGVALAYWAKPVTAQSPLPACPPPSNQEYLLLVRGQSENDRARIASILPEESSVLICEYLGEVVVRGGRFVSLETANAWSSYMSSVEGYESFVLRPAHQTSTGSVGSSTSRASYQPQRLGTGYAVLVEYGNQPEVATTVSQLVRPVGLAVYRQKSYLLAQYSNDPAIATATLQRLSDAQLSAVLVDAQQVVRLTPQVSRR